MTQTAVNPKSEPQEKRRFALPSAYAVYENWGSPDQQAIRTATPDRLSSEEFAAGSMGPKVHAACWFAEQTGGFAAIGSIHDTQALLRGQAGTRVAFPTAVRAG
jgi:carbamate kinase